MKKEKKVCSTMPELLALMTREYGSRKTGAVLHRYHSTPPLLFVREHFDDGKGHSGAFTSAETPITEEVFQKALEECYISGKLEPGYVSTCEFLVTDLGNLVHAQFVQIGTLARTELHLEEGVRACDILPLLSRSFPAIVEEVVETVLNELVRRDRAERYEHGGQKFYLLPRPRDQSPE